MQEKVRQITKRLYGIIHQAKLLVDSLGSNLQAIYDAPIQDKLNTLAQIKTYVITIQLLLQDWKSAHHQVQVSTLVTIQAASTEDPPVNSPS